jgi:hypothetical protein
MNWKRIALATCSMVFASITGCDSDTSTQSSKPETGDKISISKITIISPLDTNGLIEYRVDGFNRDKVESHSLGEYTVVKKGTHEFSTIEQTRYRDWGDSGAFTACAYLSRLNHDSSWIPLAWSPNVIAPMK